MGGGSSRNQKLLVDFHNATRAGECEKMLKLIQDHPVIDLVNMHDSKVLLFDIFLRL